MTNEVDMLLHRRTGCEIDLVEMVFQNKQADNPAGIVPSKKRYLPVESFFDNICCIIDSDIFSKLS